MPGNELVQSLARGLDLVRLLAESSGGMELPEILAVTGLKRPTCHNLLRTLASRDFVVREGGVYRVGPAVYMLVAEDAASTVLAKAEEAVRFLAKELPDYIVSFSESVGGEAIERFCQYPDRMLMMRNSGRVLTPYRSASGLGVLAYATPEVRQIIQQRHPFEVRGVEAWGSEEKLEAFLATVRAKEEIIPPFSTNVRFRISGVPAFSSDRRFVGVLGAAWHSTPERADQETEVALRALHEAAEQMTAEREKNR